MSKEISLVMESESEITALKHERSGSVSSDIELASDREPSRVEAQRPIVLTVIVPVYKEEGNIDEFLRRIMPILESVTGAFEVIFALDPSPDRTEERILAARKSDRRVKLLKFSRRFGQPFATLAGLQYPSREPLPATDLDLPAPPALILPTLQTSTHASQAAYRPH